DLVRARVDEPRKGGARRFLPLDPVLPWRALLVPVGEVLLVRGAHRVRERSLRAGVDVDLVLEDGEAVTATLRERRFLNGQGRPFAGPRAAGARSPAPARRAAPSRERIRGRRSREPCLHSARRRASQRRTDGLAG